MEGAVLLAGGGAVSLDDAQQQVHGLLQHLLPLLASGVEQSLRRSDGGDEVLEGVELDSDVAEGVCVPQLGVRRGVGHKREHDVIDDLEHVRLDQLPGVGVGDGRVDVVEGLLHHPGAHVHLPSVLIQALQHGGEDAATKGLQIPLSKLLVLLGNTTRTAIPRKNYYRKSKIR